MFVVVTVLSSLHENLFLLGAVVLLYGVLNREKWTSAKIARRIRRFFLWWQAFQMVFLMNIYTPLSYLVLMILGTILNRVHKQGQKQNAEEGEHRYG